MVTDLLQYGEVRDLNRDLRWAMIWAGYFGLWVSAALAIQWERCRPAQLKRCAVERAQTLAAAPAVDAPAAPSLEAWESAIDALVKEMSTLPGATRSELAQRLSDRAGYELADDWTGGEHNRRAEILRRFARRLESLDRKAG